MRSVSCGRRGHHAGPNRGMGFCLFNNIAIAARYAQKRYGVDRVAIADWDVHHGNGTQEIFWNDPSVFYFSTHQYPWYPGTGSSDERPVNPSRRHFLISGAAATALAADAAHAQAPVPAGTPQTAPVVPPNQAPRPGHAGAGEWLAIVSCYSVPRTSGDVIAPSKAWERNAAKLAERLARRQHRKG